LAPLRRAAIHFPKRAAAKRATDFSGGPISGNSTNRLRSRIIDDLCTSTRSCRAPFRSASSSGFSSQSIDLARKLCA